MKVAAIDIGSNSIHMVVARIDADGHFTLLDRAKEMVRLGKGTLAARALSREAMQAGIQALATFKRLADTQQIDRVLAVATSAVREAKNGGDFIAQIGRELGIHVDLITGREEARLIHLAVSNALDLRDASTVLVDVGGGSVELVLADRGIVKLQESLKLGVLRLAERFFEHDPPARDEVDALEEYLDRQLASFYKRARSTEVGRFIGTSGTVLNLAAIALQMDGGAAPERLHGITLRAKDVQRVRKLVVRSDRDERQRLPGLDRRRVDTIVPGAILIDHVMRRLEVAELTTCEWALREGVLLDFIRRHGREIEENETIADPRRRSVVHLGRRLNFEEGHSQQVARLALALFDQTADRHGLGAREREWLEFAALLHDVGNHIAHSRHHRHSYYLIVHGELLGFDPKEIRLIAALARYHRKAGPKEEDEELEALPNGMRAVVPPLAALLRVADALDRSHFSVVRGVDVTGRGKDVTIGVRTGGPDAELELWAARRKADIFEQVFGLRLTLQVQVEE
ncbi:MAG: Ppx/GppA family phosphatase [Deltaproteobacteria bacterium]|nr:Ppx/GppA family phosphatase [Deltaproteobacteria bacterium]